MECGTVAMRDHSRGDETFRLTKTQHGDIPPSPVANTRSQAERLAGRREPFSLVRGRSCADSPEWRAIRCGRAPHINENGPSVLITIQRRHDGIFSKKFSEVGGVGVDAGSGLASRRRVSE